MKCNAQIAISRVNPFILYFLRYSMTMKKCTITNHTNNNWISKKTLVNNKEKRYNKEETKERAYPLS